MDIIKRNGEITTFNKDKIENAILKSMKYGSGIYKPEIAKKISIEIEEYCKESDKTPTVSEIEFMVYEKLIKYKQKITAKSYEGFRAIQSFKREVNTTDDSIMGLLNKTNKELINENSNKNSYLAATQRDLIAGEISKDITKRKLIVPSYIVQAHDDRSNTLS